MYKTLNDYTPLAQAHIAKVANWDGNEGTFEVLLPVDKTLHIANPAVMAELTQFAEQNGLKFTVFSRCDSYHYSTTREGGLSGQFSA